MKIKTTLSFLSIFSKLSFLLIIFGFSVSFGQVGSCKATLKVDKDRNSRSTPLDGTYYKMNITNNSSSDGIFLLSIQDANSNCSNNDGKSNLNNVKLNSTFLDEKLNPISQITINQGETINFFVHITVPQGTSIDNWSCAKVIAKSKFCKDFSVQTTLHTLVINPNDD